MSDLRECPHCGEKTSIHDWLIGNERVIYCGKCKTQGPSSPTEAEAAALWNALPRRAEPAPDLVDAMHDAISDCFEVDEANNSDFSEMAASCAAVAAAHADARVRDERERWARYCDAEAAIYRGQIKRHGASIEDVARQALAEGIAAAIREGRDGE